MVYTSAGMSLVRRQLLVAAVLAVAQIPGFAADAFAQSVRDPVRASISVSSTYIQNGLSQTEDGSSVRIAADFEHESGFFAGGYLANVGYEAEYRFSKPREQQAVLYSGFVWRRGPWRTNVSVSRYLYPDIVRSYDYTRLAVTTSFRDRYFLTLGQSDTYLAVYDRAEHVRAGIALPLMPELELSANAGRFRIDGYEAGTFTFWDVGVSKPFGRFAADLRFHDSTAHRSSLIGNRDPDLWVLSLTYSFLPLDR